MSSQDRTLENRAKYRAAHRDKIPAQNRAYRAAHKDRIAAQNRAYNATHRSVNAEKHRASYINNKTEIATKQHCYYLNNKASIKKKQHAYTKMHAVEVIAKHRNYNMIHKAQIREKQHVYNTTHEVQINARQRRCRAAHRQQLYDKQYTSTLQSTNRSKNTKRNSCMFDEWQSTRNACRHRYRYHLRQQIKQRICERRLLNCRSNQLTTTRNGKQFTRNICRLTQTLRQIKIRRVIQSSLALRRLAFRTYTSTVKLFQDRMINFCQSISYEVNASTLTNIIGGSRKHTNHSEAYSFDVEYRHLISDKTFIVDSTGCVNNLYTVRPINDSKSCKGVQWSCDDRCLVRQTTITRVIGFIQLCASANKEELKHIFSNIDKCFNICRNVNKTGHSVTCIENPDCPSSLRCLRELSPHYSSLRYLVQDVYRVKKYSDAVDCLDLVLSTGDVSDIENTVNLIKRKVQSKNQEESDIQEEQQSELHHPILNEEKLVDEYKRGIGQCTIDINKFHDKPCRCCERLCLASDVKCLAVVIDQPKSFTDAWLQLQAYWIIKYDVFDSNHDFYDLSYICNYCKNSLDSGKIPIRCVLNGLEVDPLPHVMKSMNVFESILIQKAKCFQTVVRLGSVRHRLPPSAMLKGVKGRVVYLPLPLQPNSDMIPTGLAPNHELHVLVNGVPTKSNIIWQSVVDVTKLKSVLQTLKEINPLYQDLAMTSTDLDTYVSSNDSSLTLQPGPTALLQKLTPIEASNVFHHYSIHPIHADQPSKQLETFQLKQCVDKPLSNFDKNLDLMCFPDLYPMGRNGKHESTRFARITDSDFRVSRLLNMNGRFRRNQQYLFHLLFDCDIKNLSSSISHMLRQCKSGARTVADIVKQIDSGDRQLESNLSSLFGNIRGTREYWYARQGEINCMMKEFGPPTWFLTLSCAEYTWDNLHDHLRTVNSDMTGVDNLTPGELCACDPVSVCRHYHNRFHSILRNLILSKSNPVLGQVEHYFWRVEYQMRGAPHIHLVLWIKSAPLIGENTDEQILNFISKYVTCAIPYEHTSPNLFKYVNNFQSHKCSQYCLRKFKTDDGKFTTHCRFGFPRSVTTRAKLNDAFSTMRHRQTRKSSKRLYELPRKDYEKNINDYNPALLLVLGANVDVQYIGEKSWSLAKYVTSYITKAEKLEIEDLWQELTHKSLCSRLWSLGLKALTHRQCGAYEAADRLMGTRLFGKSESIRFVNTNPPDQRNRILKPYKELAEMKSVEPDREDIYTNSYLDDYYPNRPDELDAVSLYEFMKWFDRLPCDNKTPQGSLLLKNSLGLLKKRQKPYVINHIHHDPRKSPELKEKYYHSLIMLFKPWRDETKLINDTSLYEDEFTLNCYILPDMLAYHNKLNLVFETAEIAEQKLASNTQPSQMQPADPNDCVNAVCGRETNEAEQAMEEIVTVRRSKPTISFEQINLTISKLNADQLRIFNTVRSVIEGGKESLRIFVSGSGGTGKSYLINSISEYMSQYDSGASDEHQSVSVAVTAPTGLAAFNIGGVTIHRLLMLPVEHGTTAKYEKLGSESRLILTKTLSALRLLIIDEISMVSSLLLTYIHLRLCEITGHHSLFGGINVMVLGDLLQIPPVKGTAPFMPLNREEIRSKLESIGAVNLWETFEYDELTINVRQSSDQVYSELLSRVRVGETSTDDISLLQSRLISSDGTLEPVTVLYQELIANGQRPICLMSKVDACKQMNEEMLGRLNEPVVVIESIDQLDGIKSKKVGDRAAARLQELKSDSSRTAGLESELKLALGAQIMLRRNMNMEAGLVNGSIGTVKEFIYNNRCQVTELKIVFNNTLDIALGRCKIAFELMKGIYVYRRQFPVSLSYAITIHKCQGLSLDCALIDIGSSIFGSGMAYVALSRVTNLNGLHLINLASKKIVADIKSVTEYNRLRAAYRPDLAVLPIPKKSVVAEKHVFRTSCQPMDIDFETENHNDRLALDDKQRADVQHPLFNNIDRVSCYANSIAQVLLHVTPLSRCIENTVITDPEAMPVTYKLQQLLQNINGKQSEFSSLPLRSAVHERYSCTVQQDASEFLLDILNKLDCETGAVRQLFCGIQGEEERCTRYPHCTNTSITGHDLFRIMRLYFPETEADNNSSINFKSLLQQWFAAERSCHLCGSMTEQRTIVRSAPRLLFISLCLFHNRNRRVNCPITGYTAGDVRIGGKRYRTVAAVCHRGTSTESGHYWCLLRHKDKWLSVSDTKVSLKGRFVANLLNVYILVLEQISSLEE